MVYAQTQWYCLYGDVLISGKWSSYRFPIDDGRFRRRETSLIRYNQQGVLYVIRLSIFHPFKIVLDV